MYYSCQFSFGFFPHVEFTLHGVFPWSVYLGVSTDLNQLLHVIVNIGPLALFSCLVHGFIL